MSWGQQMELRFKLAWWQFSNSWLVTSIDNVIGSFIMVVFTSVATLILAASGSAIAALGGMAVVLFSFYRWVALSADMIVA